MIKGQEITEKTKKKVMERQRHRSISGMYLTDVNYHHVKTVGDSGVGYEWNVVALLPIEHRQLHDGADIVLPNRRRYSNKEFKTMIRNHLILNYKGWSQQKCKVHKNWKEEDYAITRLYTNKKPVEEGFKRKARTEDKGG